ncbi:MAG: HD domain-containing protein [Proteobacteria bacterium]|nr:HD domain-containing protein [Pseudomonadota bacterium]MBU4294798.1 HD domain-containing protein [Pseudomonadota bacterium]MCG2748076.1 HD domain-containing protein [Desulfobulbaceae bacterium]
MQKKYPDRLCQAIQALAARYGADVFVVGGTVRDWLRGVAARDLDLAVSRSALDFAEALARELQAAFVLLDEEEQTARVVWGDYVVDVAGFRGGALDIRQDLLKRDFTMNALALPFSVYMTSAAADRRLIIDPADGLTDLQGEIIRLLAPEALTDDPLRLLRAFRFFAESGFGIEPHTWQWIIDYRQLLAAVSPERISYELDCIMASHRAFAATVLLDRAEVLAVLFPELGMGAGITQPASHHLDVRAHNLEALRWMERIIHRPADFYPTQGEALAKYLAGGKRIIWLKWAALFHDLGKPAALRLIDQRITFHNHDRIGVELVAALAKRLRWSREKSDRVSRLIALHMWPFHLSNVRRKKGVTARACLKIYKAAGEDLPGLFLLAMADSLAGQGAGKPEGMEEELVALYNQVLEVCITQVEPVLTGPRLVTGSDLLELGLEPGPAFKDILGEVEKAQVEGKFNNREQALAWVRHFLSFH